MTQKNPAFQFYSGDFLSGRVATYSIEQVGLYSLLLAFDWSLTGLPLEPESLARLSRVSLRKFSTLWRVVSEQFVVRDGRYYNPRLQLERERQEDWREKSAKGGKKGAATRASRVLENPPQPKGNPSSSSSSSDQDQVQTTSVKTVARSAQPIPSPDVVAVLDHYRARHPQRRPGAKETKVIARALASGYSPADLCEAIDGNARDPWHASKGKHEISYVLRDADHIDTARASLAMPLPPASPNGAAHRQLSRTEQGRANLAEAMERRKRDGTAID